MRRKKILYFLSYADSIEESIQVGHIDRLCKELRALLQNFEITLFSKDCPAIFKKLKDRFTRNIVFRGIPFSIFGNANFSGIKGYFRKICSAIIFLEYQALSPFLHISDFKKADVYYARHISGALAGVIGKKIINKKIKVIIRLYWSWSRYNLNENSKMLFLFTSVIEKIILRNCNCLIVASEEAKREYAGLVSEEQFRIIPNWVDTELFKPRLCLQDNEYDIAFIGRLENVKNPLLLLEAINLTNRKRNTPLKLLCIGNGSLKDEVLNFCQRYHIVMHMLNYLPNSKLPEYLNKCNVYCIPSRHEGCPKALLEAMSCGLICIGTRVKGITDIIKHESTGFLCKEDPESLAVAIDTALKDQTKNAQIRKNAVKFINENYSFERIMRDIANTLMGAP